MRHDALMLLDGHIAAQSSQVGAFSALCGVIEVDRQPCIRMVILRRDVPGRCFSSSPLNGSGTRAKGREQASSSVRSPGAAEMERTEARGSRNSFGGYQ